MYKYRVGIVFGCFIPLHTGHRHLIETARQENDYCILAVAGYPGDRGEGCIPYDDRIRLIQQLYHDKPDCIVTNVNDHEIGLTGTFSETAWKTWSDELFRNAQEDKNDPNRIYTWYTGDPAYIEKLKQVLPDNHTFRLFDRGQIPYSGTQIRSDLQKYKHQIHPAFWSYLKKHNRV